MYFLDPEMGRRRRALARDQWTRMSHRVPRRLEAMSRDLGNRAYGLAAEARSMLTHHEESPPRPTQKGRKAQSQGRNQGVPNQGARNQGTRRTELASR